ncbi:hypothetical protein ABAC460_14115 [Asticcacaulis sp. AC460]|uniref:WcbI family polysaccharide biosynthesis putative acetyltransferase n=1 Tax=Asticcacaulis sp. AC460 TaxID=1282360 RepID=UPI0003C40CAD|nr:WcbI family polysaccharide biosynthesis putative acetyltransferase [Asticcacaulis sp. AC460]ESQ88912.1 hypothetical protein ABAC460_14115 [Asticcacaulis sp. AC460]
MTSHLKIAIVGGCQSEGLREATLALIPDAEIKSWHVSVNPPDPPEVILAKIADADVVVTQMQPEHGYASLTVDGLKAQGFNAHFLPTFTFPGFHPDLSYIFTAGGVLSAVHCDFHSRIAVAGFLLGLTPQQTLPLYNSVVFDELGYFDVFPAARVAVEQGLVEAGFQPQGLIDAWLKEIGPFMYMANHPHVRVLATLAHQLYVRLGLVDAAKPVPSVKKDHLGESFTWPVYTAMAKRFGVQGSNDFQRPAWLVQALWETRKIPLGTYLKDLFEFYATVPREQLETEIMLVTRERLRGLLA